MRTQRSNILYMVELELWFRFVLLQRLFPFTSSYNRRNCSCLLMARECAVAQTVVCGWALEKVRDLLYMEISICQKRIHYKMARLKSTRKFQRISFSVLSGTEYLYSNVLNFEEIRRESSPVWGNMQGGEIRGSEFLSPYCRLSKLSWPPLSHLKRGAKGKRWWSWTSALNPHEIISLCKIRDNMFLW